MVPSEGHLVTHTSIFELWNSILQRDTLASLLPYRALHLVSELVRDIGELVQNDPGGSLSILLQLHAGQAYTGCFSWCAWGPG